MILVSFHSYGVLMCPVPIWSFQWCQCIISNPALDVYCFKHNVYYFPQPSLSRFLLFNRLETTNLLGRPLQSCVTSVQTAFCRRCSVAERGRAFGCRLSRFRTAEGCDEFEENGCGGWAAGDGISCLIHGECIKNVSWTCFNPENGCGRPSAKATKSEWGCYQHLPAIYGHNVGMVY